MERRSVDISYHPLDAPAGAAEGGNDMSEWISVKDRLPERSTPVLCYTENGEMFLGVDWLYWPDGNVTFKQYKSTYLPDWPDVTHWIPLPKEGET